MSFDSGLGACGWMDNVVGLFVIVYNALQLYESYFWLADPMNSSCSELSTPVDSKALCASPVQHTPVFSF